MFLLVVSALMLLGLVNGLAEINYFPGFPFGLPPSSLRPITYPVPKIVPIFPPYFLEIPAYPGCVCDVRDSQRNPLCCNGKTYDNLCDARCGGNDVSVCEDGPCSPQFPDPTCICPFYFRAEPLCCDGQDFSNPCEAQCAGFESEDCSNGFCKIIFCPAIVDPVCCDGTTYGNSCAASQSGNEVEDCVSGVCDACICTKEYAPVCCDGQTYSNDCLSACSGYQSNKCNFGAC